MLNKKSRIIRMICVILLIASFYSFLTPKETFSLVPDISVITPNVNNPPILILSDDDFANYGFSGTGSMLFPYIIQDYSIITSSKAAITINDTTKHFVIENCYLDGLDYGIFIDNVTAGTAIILDNYCEFNDYTAITIYNAPSTVVTNNICKNNYIGIHLEDSPDSEIRDNICENIQYTAVYLRDSENATVENNTFVNNYEGIRMSNCGSSLVANNKLYDNNFGCITIFSSSDVEIIDNECINSIYYGIRAINVDSSNISGNICNDNNISIFVAGSQFNTIMNNTCYNNQIGIQLIAISDWNILNYNLLQENEEYGISIAISDDNTVYHNSLIDNNLVGTIHGSSQAFDNGTNNNWYNFSLSSGNYWSDWSGFGGYLVDGIGGSVDIYPLSTSIIPIMAETYQIGLIAFVLASISFISIVSINRRK